MVNLVLYGFLGIVKYSLFRITLTRKHITILYEKMGVEVGKTSRIKKKKIHEKKIKVSFLALGLVMPRVTAAILQARGKLTEGQRHILKT